MKICMSFNLLSLYRRSIYTMIDREYDCDWYIENIETNIKTFPDSDLKRVSRMRNIYIGSFYWECGLIKLLWKDYDVYVMLGATRNLSLYIFCLLKKLFYSKKKRIYFWTHAYYGKESKMELVLWKKPLLKLPDGIFTYGDYAKKIMVEDGFDEKKIYPIHNSLDYDAQLCLRKEIVPAQIYSDHFGNVNPVLIFIGRLTKVKRLDMLVDALNLLNKEGKYYNLVFVGDGSERKTLEEKVCKYDLTHQVWFYGECYDEKENATLLYNADICVAPGNVGLTSIHSMMFGCPVISHNDFALQMPEFEVIKPKRTGDFFDYGNTDNLACVISQWICSKKNKREEVREACFNEIDKHWNPYYQIGIFKKTINKTE